MDRPPAFRSVSPLLSRADGRCRRHGSIRLHPHRPGVTTNPRHRARLELVWSGIALDLLYTAEKKLVRLESDWVVAVASGSARKRRGHLARHSSLFKDTRKRSFGLVAVSRLDAMASCHW